MIRVVVIDDHPIVRDGLVANLNDAGDIEVVGAGADAQSAVDLALRLRPDAVVLDLELPGRSGLDVIASIREESPATRIVVFTAYAGEERVAAAFERGADSYILKGTPTQELLATIRAVVAGESRVPPEIAAQLLRAVRSPRERLTVREREILAFVAEGLSNRAIAERLDITERTVKYHIGEILGRLGATNRAQAITIARERGLT